MTQQVSLTRKLHQRLVFGHAQRCTGVELAKIDGFASIRLGFIPVLPDLQNQPCVELKLPPPQNLRDPETQARAFSSANIPPALKGPEGGLHRRLDLFVTSLLVNTHDLGRARRIHGTDLVRSLETPATDHQIVFTAYLSASSR